MTNIQEQKCGSEQIVQFSWTGMTWMWPSASYQSVFFSRMKMYRIVPQHQNMQCNVSLQDLKHWASSHLTTGWYLTRFIQVTRYCMPSSPSAHSNSVSLSLVLNLPFGCTSVTQQFSKHICRGHTESSQLAWLHNAYPNKLKRGRKWLPTSLISHHCIQCEVLEGTYDRPVQHATCRPNASQPCNIIPTWLVISREKLAATRDLGRLCPACTSWVLPLAL